MYKTIKFTAQDVDSLRFISDQHFGHDREFLWGKRGFKSVTEHDETLITRWNESCDANSLVFSLGDFVFIDGDGSKFANLIRRLNFRKLFLLIGNHTSGQRQHYIKTLSARFPDAVTSEGQLNYEVYPLEMPVDGQVGIKTVVFLPVYAEILVGHKRVCLSHYPIVSHNEQDKTSWSLSGHSHSNCSLTNKLTGTGFRLDMGIESFGRPLSFNEIKQFFVDNGREVDVKDHHKAD